MNDMVIGGFIIWAIFGMLVMGVLAYSRHNIDEKDQETND